VLGRGNRLFSAPIQAGLCTILDTNFGEYLFRNCLEIPERAQTRAPRAARGSERRHLCRIAPPKTHDSDASSYFPNSFGIGILRSSYPRSCISAVPVCPRGLKNCVGPARYLTSCYPVGWICRALHFASLCSPSTPSIACFRLQGLLESFKAGHKLFLLPGGQAVPDARPRAV
jgi:hypothetical protein